MENREATTTYFEVSDIKGNFIKEIKYKYLDKTYSIYDTKLNKNYLVTGHFGSLPSIDYSENNVDKAFIDKGLMKI